MHDDLSLNFDVSIWRQLDDAKLRDRVFLCTQSSAFGNSSFIT